MVDTKVTDVMISLIRTVLRDDCSLSSEDVDVIKNNIGDIYLIAKRNDLAHIVGYALEKHELISPDDPGFAQFQKQQYLAIYRYEGMEYETRRIRQTLEAHKIDFILLKGGVIRDLYPEGWMRTSSDIDVLVRPDDLDRAEEALTEAMSCKKGMEGRHDRALFSDGGVHIELHFALMEDDRANSASKVLCEAWNYATAIADGMSEHEFSEDMFYFYHIAHIAKHVECAGSGIRPFIDLWLINKNEEKNVDARRALLMRGSLDEFSSLCNELAGYWFGDSKAISETGKKFELFILNCGLYGSEENRIAISKNDGKGTVGYIFKRLFPSYATLKILYPILGKHKWLTPFCQVARWFKIFSGEKTAKAINEVKLSLGTDEKNVSDLQAFFAEIGLCENKK